MTAMLEHARRHPREEVCGLLGGRDGTAVRYYPATNIAAHPAREYLMDPRQQIDAMRRMREGGEALLGIFHSHPDSAAEPSDTDLARAAYPDTIYLIAGPVGERMELRAYHFDGTGFAPAAIQITHNR